MLVNSRVSDNIIVAHEPPLFALDNIFLHCVIVSCVDGSHVVNGANKVVTDGVLLFVCVHHVLR